MAGAGSYLTLHLHVDNADETIAQAVAAGGKLEGAITEYRRRERRFGGLAAAGS